MSIKDRENSKLTKEDIDKVRHIEGFPIGSDEDIIALSNPPYYTACPNPFIEEFIKEFGKLYDEETDDYKCEPFSSDIREGKNDPMYMAHGYHTKVPFKAIMKYILHYTNPGDLVLDAFSGTGMTGVASQLCAEESQIRLWDNELSNSDLKKGKRYCVLNDLSTVATFISGNYNTPIDLSEFKTKAEDIIDECNKEFSWMYKTPHIGSDEKMFGTINYVVWSDIFICPHCGDERTYWDTSIDKDTNQEIDYPKCKVCGLNVNINNLERKKKLIYDEALNSNVEIVDSIPVLIKYTFGKKQYKKSPGTYDLEIIKKINEMKNFSWYPVKEIPAGFNTEQPRKSHNITHVHQFYTKRNLLILSHVYNKICTIDSISLKNRLLFWFTSIYTRSHKMNRYMPNHNRHVGPLSGTLYVPYFQAEISIINLLEDKLKSIMKVNVPSKGTCVTTQSATDLRSIPADSIDYIFTDPPFGDNINYSELNSILESWLKVSTNNNSEAIINSYQNKSLSEYQNLMTRSFGEYYRVLKPNRWITVEFSNSKNAVWIAIQEALTIAGFIVADIRVLDKVKGTTKQLSYTSSVKKDLIISAYKPAEKKNLNFRSEADANTAWDFVRNHLKNLPITVINDGKIESIREREAYSLYDRMLSYHVVRQIPVPLDAADFYEGLEERFIKRDNMFFLHDQVSEYDENREIYKFESFQFELFVTDEKSAITWLYKELQEPQTYSQLQLKFVKELKKSNYEKMPELLEILRENFLLEEEKWYIPDRTKEIDLIRLREKRLLKEFEEYLKGKGKLKLFRIEAIRVGFSKLWSEKEYKKIVAIAERLPEKVVQEDDKLLMYYDISLTRQK